MTSTSSPVRVSYTRIAPSPFVGTGKTAIGAASGLNAAAGLSRTGALISRVCRPVRRVVQPHPAADPDREASTVGAEHRAVHPAGVLKGECFLTRPCVTHLNHKPIVFDECGGDPRRPG